MTNKFFPFSEPTSTGRIWFVGVGVSCRKVAGPFDTRKQAVEWIKKAKRSAS